MKTLIILVGPPCSGKSTYAKQKELEGFTRISQDDMGRYSYYIEFLKSIRNHDNVIIDRMNFNKNQRAKFIDKAEDLGYSIHVVEFLVASEICLKRAEKRINHPTIKEVETLKKVLNFYRDNYEKPEPNEYNTYEVING
jgi:predicted kinase